MAKMNEISPYRDDQICQIQVLERDIAERDQKIATLEKQLGQKNETLLKITGIPDEDYNTLEKLLDNQKQITKRHRREFDAAKKIRRAKNKAAYKKIVRRLMKFKKELTTIAGSDFIRLIDSENRKPIFYFRNGNFILHHDDEIYKSGDLTEIFLTHKYYWRFLHLYIAELDIEPEEFEKTVMTNLTKYLNGEKD